MAHPVGFGATLPLSLVETSATTMASADLCPFTCAIARARAPGARPRVRWHLHAFRRGPQSGSHSEPRSPFGQISPNKNISLQCTTAAFTLLLDTAGFVILC